MQINLAHLAPATDVLGPGRRAIIWVQGCHKRCHNCITPQMQPFAPAELLSPDELAARIFALGPVTGITLVGGEPFEQAAALSALIDRLHHEQPLSVFTYSGYTIEEIRQKADPAQLELLARSDVLVDGEYKEEEACDLLWRGSSNQRLHLLTDRSQSLAHLPQARGRRLEFSVTHTGEVVLIGIPAPDFYREFRRRLEEAGVDLQPTALRRPSGAPHHSDGGMES